MAKNNVNIDFEEKVPDLLEGFEVKRTLKVLDTAKRHVIQVNDIGLEKNTYATTNTIQTRELIGSEEKVNAIAIFCNEYIPEHFAKSDYITYALVVNGESIPVVPINSEKNGVKIIKTSELFLDSHYAKYISERIRSAKLIITIKTPNTTETPYISNLKILKSEGAL